MPSPLRFRATYGSEKDPLIPRTPKSPRGFTGDPVPPINSTLKRFPLRILFGILATAALLSLALFSYRGKLIPSLDIPIRSSVYWTTKSAAHAGLKERESFGPSGVTVKAVFVDQDAFQLQGARGDRAWLGMFPKGDGRVLVSNPRRHGLPVSAGAVDGDGALVSNAEIYEVAVVKQLDCMAFLRQILIDYDHEMHPAAHDRAHAFHCLDHVRQALLCAADTTLEPTGNGGVSTSVEQHYVGHQTLVEKPSAVFESALHTCKNWTAVRNWIEENSVQ